MQNRKIQNAHKHHHFQAGHHAQHGGGRLFGTKVGKHGTRTGGMTTNGQTNGKERQSRILALIAAGNRMRKREVHPCQSQLVSSDCMSSLLRFGSFASRQ